MKCECAKNPPCKRCVQFKLDCVFEKPTSTLVSSEESAFSSHVFFLLIFFCQRRLKRVENNIAEILDKLSELLNHIQPERFSASRPNSSSPSSAQDAPPQSASHNMPLASNSNLLPPQVGNHFSGMGYGSSPFNRSATLADYGMRASSQDPNSTLPPADQAIFRLPQGDSSGLTNGAFGHMIPVYFSPVKE